MTNDRNDQVENDPALSQSLTVRELIFQILSSGVDLDERVVINIAPWSPYSEMFGTSPVSVDDDGLLVLNSNGEKWYGFDDDDDDDLD